MRHDELLGGLGSKTRQPHPKTFDYFHRLKVDGLFRLIIIKSFSYLKNSIKTHTL